MLPDYAQALRESSLPYKEQLAGLVRPAVFLRAHPASGESVPVGVSRLGGLPDLPPAVEWPRWHGKPQSFIAQVNLAELPEFSEGGLLPRYGFLFFFYDSEQSTSGTFRSEQGSFAVFYVADSVQKMQPHDVPKGLDQKAVFRPAGLSFTVGVTEPGWEHPVLERIGLSFEERLKYAEVVSQAVKSAHGLRHPCHQMLGYPDPMQYAVAWDCECPQHGFWEAGSEKRRALEPLIRERAEDWELLLQVDCDMHTGMDWPGAGRIYYMIRRQALELCQFDEAWFVLQST